MRKTKIIATLGPATESPETIRELIEAGVNVFRLNMSHAHHDWVRDVVARIREAEEAFATSVAVLMDLQGPSIRTGDVDEPIHLRVGAHIDILTQPDAHRGDVPCVTVNYTGLGKDVNVGDLMMVDNGEIHFKVLEITDDRVCCEAATDSVLTSRRHINLPGVRVNLDPLTEKDHTDIALAVELRVDFVALSFAQDAAHVRLLKNLLQDNACTAQVVAKIENQEAVRNLDGIIEEADAIMVARGDLGIEVHLEQLPLVQRDMMRRCRKAGRRVIVATHMLESMVENPVPTRAEVTDVAYAVFNKADAVMLSGETSVGKYPVKCVERLDRIARNVEASDFEQNVIKPDLATSKLKVANSAVTLADSIEGSKIIVFTNSGGMAHLVATLRPIRAPVYAFTPSKEVLRWLNLTWGVQSYPIEMSKHPQKTIGDAIRILQEHGILHVDDPIVIISDVLSADTKVDSIMLRNVDGRYV